MTCDGPKSRLPKACAAPLELTKEIKVLAILAFAAPATLVTVPVPLSVLGF